MSHIHTQTEAGGIYFVTTAAGDHDIYLGCFTHGINDTYSAVEESWDTFAKRMWAYGLEPVSDEPAITIEEDGQVYDHYTLREIRAEF
jgi:hypothetical protein